MYLIHPIQSNWPIGLIHRSFLRPCHHSKTIQLILHWLMISAQKWVRCWGLHTYGLVVFWCMALVIKSLQPPTLAANICISDLADFFDFGIKMVGPLVSSCFSPILPTHFQKITVPNSLSTTHYSQCKLTNAPQQYLDHQCSNWSGETQSSKPNLNNSPEQARQCNW